MFWLGNTCGLVQMIPMVSRTLFVHKKLNYLRPRNSVLFNAFVPWYFVLPSFPMYLRVVLINDWCRVFTIFPRSSTLMTRDVLQRNVLFKHGCPHSFIQSAWRKRSKLVRERFKKDVTYLLSCAFPPGSTTKRGFTKTMPKTVEVPMPLLRSSCTKYRKRSCMFSKVLPGFSRIGTPSQHTIIITRSIDLPGVV